MMKDQALGLIERLVANESEPCRYEGDRCKTHDLPSPCAVREAREELGMSASPYPKVPTELPDGYDLAPHIWDQGEAEWVALEWAPEGGWHIPGHETRTGTSETAPGTATAASAAPEIIVLPSQQVVILSGIVYRLIPGKAPGSLVPGEVVQAVHGAEDPLTSMLGALLTWRRRPSTEATADLFQAVDEWKGGR